MLESLLLKREDIQTEKSFESPKFIDTIDYLNKNLGYNAITKEENLPLAKILKSLDIRPFTKDSVQKYKEKKISNTNNRKLKIQWSSGILCFLIIFAAVHYFFGVPTLISDKAMYYTFLFMGGGFVSGMFGGVLLGETLKNKRGVWRQFDLKGYTKPIPQKILDEIVEIHARNKAITFIMDEFFEETVERPPRMKDPFLWCKLGNETYPIFCWDEPDFKGKQVG